MEATGEAGESLRQQCSSCDSCSARCWCLDCNEAMCDDCVLAHRRVTVTRSHRLINQLPQDQTGGSDGDLSRSVPGHLQLPSGNILSSPTKFCRLHPSEPLQLFCFTCSQLTCRDCQLMAHMNHRYQFASEAEATLKRQLEACAQPIRAQRDTVRRSLQDMSTRLVLIGQSKSHLKTQLQKTYVTLAQLLRTRMENMVKEIEKVHELECERINWRMVKLKQLQQSHTSLTETAEKARNTSDLSMLLTYTTQIKAQLKDLLVQDSSPPPTMAQLKVIADRKALETISHFGDLSVSWIPFNVSQTSSENVEAPPPVASSSPAWTPPTPVYRPHPQALTTNHSTSPVPDAMSQDALPSPSPLSSNPSSTFTFPGPTCSPHPLAATCSDADSPVGVPAPSSSSSFVAPPRSLIPVSCRAPLKQVSSTRFDFPSSSSSQFYRLHFRWKQKKKRKKKEAASSPSCSASTSSSSGSASTSATSICSVSSSILQTVTSRDAISPVQVNSLPPSSSDLLKFSSSLSPPTYSTPTCLTPTISAPTCLAPTCLPPTYSTPTCLPPTISTPTCLAPTCLPPTYSTSTCLPPTISAPTCLAPTCLTLTCLAPTYTAPTYWLHLQTETARTSIVQCVQPVSSILPLLPSVSRTVFESVQPVLVLNQPVLSLQLTNSPLNRPSAVPQFPRILSNTRLCTAPEVQQNSSLMGNMIQSPGSISQKILPEPAAGHQSDQHLISSQQSQAPMDQVDEEPAEKLPAPETSEGDTELSTTDISDGESEESSSVIGHQVWGLSQWQPTVPLVRLPVSLPRPGRPLPSFHLVRGFGEDEVYVEELNEDSEMLSDDDTEDTVDFTEPLSSPESSMSLEILSCSACGSASTSIICSSCGRGYHRDCHVPPVGPDIWSEWFCSLCQDLSDPSDPYSSDRPSSPQRCSLSRQNQRRCESLLLHLKVEGCSRLSEARWSRLQSISDRLSLGGFPSYQTAAQVVADIWTLFEASQDDALEQLQQSFQKKLEETLSSQLHPSVLNAPNSGPADGSLDSDSTVDEPTLTSKLSQVRKRLRDLMDVKNPSGSKRTKTE